MTISCPNGSTVAAGSPDFFTFDQAFLNANFATAIAAILTPWLLGLPTGPQETSAFCATPPVGDLPSAPDYIKLAIPWLAWVTGTYQRFGEQAREDAFNQYCVCNASGTPGCNPFWWSHGSNLGHGPYDWGGDYVGQAWVNNGSAYTLWGMWVDGSAADTCDLFWYDLTASTQHHETITLAAGWHFYPFSVSLPLLHGNSIHAGIRKSVAGMHAYYDPYPSVPASNPPQTAARLTAGSYGGETSPTSAVGNAAGVEASICLASPSPYAPPAPPPLTPPTGFPTAPTAPTCGSYQDICNAILTVDMKLDGLAQLVVMLRDHEIPPSLADGTAHAGLTGNGSVSLTQALGVRVDITSYPAGHGFTNDTPGRAVPRLGVLQLFDGTSYTDEEQVHYVHQLWFFTQLPEGSLHYSWQPGVTATITELTRGP